MNKLSSLNRKSKILSLSDSDLDGACSQIVLANAFDNVLCQKVTYSTIEQTMKDLDYSKYDFVILTDITPEDRSLFNLSDNIILLDHHDSALDLHCPEKMRHVVSGKCSALWAKIFCESKLNISLSYLNNLVYLCNDYDLWTLANGKSKLLNQLFYKYFSEKFQKRFFSGNTRFTPEEILFLRKKKKEFNDTFDNLDVYDTEKINGCFVQCTQFHNDICHKLMNEQNYKIVFFRNPQTKKVSVRNSCPDIHIGNVLQGLGIGGGHKDAGGFYEPDIEVLQKKLRIIEDAMYAATPSVRK